MREIACHTLNGLNDALSLRALDEPGHGGACHEYSVVGYGTPPGYEGKGLQTGTELARIRFQNGPIAEAGVNGISNEVLLAIVIDRLRCFQESDFKCRENALALTKLEESLMWLQERTRRRVARGVEGTSQK